MTELIDILTKYQDETFAELNTIIPALVVDYDSSTYTITAKPAIKKKYLDGEVLSMPDIFKVPVIYPKTNLGHITFPLKPGDSVLLLVCQRDTDTFVLDNKEVEPPTNRKFELQDAVALPGFTATNANNVDTDEALTVRYNQSFIKLKEDNSIEINAVNDVTINGDVTVNGNLTADEVTADGIDLSTHTHGGVEPGAGFTGEPQ